MNDYENISISVQKNTTLSSLSRMEAAVFVAGLLNQVSDSLLITITSRGSSEDSSVSFATSVFWVPELRRFLSEQPPMSPIPLPGRLWVET